MGEQRDSLAVMHVIGGLSRAAGGTTAVALGMCRELALKGIATSLVWPRGEDDANARYFALETYPLHSRSATLLGAPAAYRYLRETLQRRRIDLLHIHGLWAPVLVAAAAAASAESVPYVLQPHGMLEPWSLAQSAAKKRLAMTLYQQRLLAKASAVLCCSEKEVEAFDALRLPTPTFVVPNGVDAPITAASYEEALSSVGRTALFLSRLHRKKGVVALVRAWQAAAPPGWALVIAGPDEDGEGARAHALAKAGQLASIEFTGEVYADRKEALFRRASLFVLPTHSENFGIAVVEAMMRGLPVITTTGTPWSMLDELGIGWCVEPGDLGLRGALASATRMSDDELRGMGARAAEFAQQFQWPNVVNTLIASYERALAGKANSGGVALTGAFPE